MENRNQNLYTALVCIVLLFFVWCFCSIFGDQNQKPNQEFEIEIEEENAESKIKIEIEEKKSIGEIEIENEETDEFEIVKASRIINTVETTPIENKTVEEITSISDVSIADDYYYPLSEEDRYIALCIMACECPYEPWEGKVTVAECILNFMSYYGYSMSTVKQYFDGWSPSVEYSDPECWATLNAAIDEVFVYGNLPTEETVLWFYNPKIGTSPWHESQKFVTEICCHRFFAPWD